MTFVPPIGRADHFIIKGDFMKKGRFKTALLFVGIAVVVNAVVSSLFALIVKSSEDVYLDAFRYVFVYCFMLFGGSSVISAILLIATRIKEHDAFTYGAGFYYKTILCCSFLKDSMELSTALLVSSVIVGLVCYIFWSKNKD